MGKVPAGANGGLGLSARSQKYPHMVVLDAIQVYSDLCLDCGNIVSTCIKDPTDREWSKSIK